MTTTVITWFVATAITSIVAVVFATLYLTYKDRYLRQKANNDELRDRLMALRSDFYELKKDIPRKPSNKVKK